MFMYPQEVHVGLGCKASTMPWHQAQSSETAPEMYFAVSPQQQCQQSAPARLAPMARNTILQESCQMGGPFTVPSHS